MDSLIAPFIRVYYKEQEITVLCESLRYKASEKDDDECILSVRSDNRLIADQPYFQEKAIIVVVWGFIGDNNVAKRTIRISDVEWDYDDKNISGSITGVELGASIKHASNDGVYRDTSLIGVAGDIANRHGLKGKLEMPNADTKLKPATNAQEALANLRALGENVSIANESFYLPIPTVKLDLNQFQAQMKANATRRREIDSIAQKLYGRPYSQILADWQQKIGTFSIEAINKQINYQLYLNGMKTYPFIAQGNKTDKQLITELGMKENGGPFIGETRDDELIIRKRNWNKKPYKLFEWADGRGPLISFKVNSMHRNKRGSATNLQFGAWDDLNKRYMEGNANNLSDNAQSTLAHYQQLYDNYKILTQKFGQAVVGTEQKQVEIGSPRSFLSGNIIGAGTSLSDQTVVKKVLRIPIYAIDKLKVLEKTLNELRGSITPNKKIVDANNDGIEDAYQQASNMRNSAEQELSPYDFDVIGDTGIWPGEILTFTGVGKKYSGNYYVAEVTHEVNPSKGYCTSGSLARKGSNVKVNNDQVKVTDVGKEVNTQIGSDTTSKSSSIITLNQNIR